MSITIVTRNQYILASRINHVTLDENTAWVDVRNTNGKYVSLKEVSYNINIYYVPEVSATNGKDHQQQCQVTVRKRVDAHEVFRSLVEQIREQMPDSLFIQKALEKMLSDVKVDNFKKRDDDDECDQLVPATSPRKKSKTRKLNDKSASKVRPARKAKRRR